jgi:hypothetical protein
MSPTVAVAADIASVALISALEDGCDWPLGKRTKTTPSQNVIRNRKRIRCLCFPAVDPAVVHARNLAQSLEAAVRRELRILPIFETNEPHFFLKLE